MRRFASFTVFVAALAVPLAVSDAALPSDVTATAIAPWLARLLAR